MTEWEQTLALNACLKERDTMQDTLTRCQEECTRLLNRNRALQMDPRNQIVTRKQLNTLLLRINNLVNDYENGLPLYNEDKMLQVRELIRVNLGLAGNEADE